MATAAAELLRTLPQPQVSITVSYTVAQKLALIALCLRQAGLERTLSVLEREAAAKGVDLTGAGAGGGTGAGGAKPLAEGDAASLDKHTALCLAELQREAAGGAVPASCVLEAPAPRGPAEKVHAPRQSPKPKPKPSARVEAHTLDDILGDDVDYSDDEEDAGDARREDEAKPPPAAASAQEPQRKSRETPQRSEGGAREARGGRADDRAVGIEPPSGAAPRPTWIGNGKESKGERDRDRDREPARVAPAPAGRDWQREPAGWERGRAEPRREEPRRVGPPLRGGPPLPPPPPLPAGRMSGRGAPLPPPPPPPQYGRQAPLPPPPPPAVKRQRY